MIHTTNFKRILCCLLAVLMLCTCVMKPLEVNATGLEIPLGLGWLIAYYLGMSGIVIESPTREDFQALSTSFKGFVKEKDPDVESKEFWRQFQAGILESQFFGSNALVPGPNGPYDRTPLGLSPTLLAYIAAYAAKVACDMAIIMGKVEAPANMYWYNGYLFPDCSRLPTASFRFRAIVYNSSSDTYRLYCSDQPFGYYFNPVNGTESFWVNGYVYYYDFSFDSNSWKYVSSMSGGFGTSLNTILWASDNIYDRTTNELYFAGSEPLTEWVDVMHLFAINDIPEQLANGEMSPEELEERLPAVIDPSELLYQTQKEDLNEAVAEIMANLADGTLSYDDYMNSIQGEPEVDPEPEPEPEPGGSSDTEIKSGITKLVDFFTGTTYVKSPMDAIHFTSLLDVFPFNIPAGIYQTINFWNSEATPPVLVFPSLAFVDGKVTGDDFTVDFSEFPGMNKIAALIRAGNLILFAIGLLLITRKVTKW